MAGRQWALTGILLLSMPAFPSRAAVNLYSLNREIAMGKQLSAEVEREAKLVDDPILLDYLNRVAQNIVRQSDVSLPVTIRVIESGELDAFTLPGGHIYVNSGMLKLTESEAELAFVLGHEIGHVAARHATREATELQLTKIGTLPLIVFGGGWGAAVREFVAPLGTQKSARNFEAEADRLGLEYLARCGYDPSAAVDVFERIESAERKRPGRVARLYGNHPITASRIARTEKQLSRLAAGRSEWVMNTSEYEEMRLRMTAIEDNRTRQAAETGPTLIHAEKP